MALASESGSDDYDTGVAYLHAAILPQSSINCTSSLMEKPLPFSGNLASRIGSSRLS